MCGLLARQSAARLGRASLKEGGGRYGGRMRKYFTICGTVGYPRRVTKGSIFIELILLRLGVLAAVLVASGAGCRTFRSEEWARRDRCARSMPLLREEPSRPYRVVKVVSEDGDDDLIKEACEDPNVDAVIAMGFTSDVVTKGVAVPLGRTGIFAGRRRSSEETLVRGILIRYTDQPIPR